MSKRMTRWMAPVAITAAVTLVAGCANTSGGSTDAATDSTGAAASSDMIIVGTTDKITLLDPAGSYDNGSFMVMNQVFPFLVNTMPGTGQTIPSPDIAVSAEFTAPTEYTVVLKPDLTFANGNALTSSDVVFTFERQLAIADPNGPSSLLGNLESVEAVDDTTVVFHLTEPNDQTFAQILAAPPSPIVDEEVFPADSVMDNAALVAAQPFAGQYTISTFTPNELIVFEPNPTYQGMLGQAQSPVTMRYYSEASNMRLDVESGNIDVAYRSLSANDIASLETNDNLTVYHGPGGEIRYMVFNFATMPYGTAQPDADPAQAQAVRQAIAALIDREAIADQVYQGTYTPLYSYIPEGLPGAGTQFMDLYGDGQGGPDLEQATQILEDAGVETPVNLAIQYSPDHYGPSSGDEYAQIKSQLEASGLFTVSLQSTEWVQYSQDRVNDVYPIHQLGWFPDYSDADNYLTPFFSADTFLVNHYENTQVQDLIAQQLVEPDQDARAEMFTQIQDLVAEDISTLPLLQGQQIVVAGSDIQGVNLDASFKFQLGTLTR